MLIPSRSRTRNVVCGVAISAAGSAIGRCNLLQGGCNDR